MVKVVKIRENLEINPLHGNHRFLECPLKYAVLVQSSKCYYQELLTLATTVTTIYQYNIMMTSTDDSLALYVNDVHKFYGTGRGAHHALCALSMEVSYGTM